MKLKALYVGFFSGWAVVGAVRVAAYLKTNVGSPRTRSAYDAMLIILTIDFALFQYWRAQDGREVSAD